VRAWLDDVSGLVKELADVTDALVDRLGPDAGTEAAPRLPIGASLTTLSFLGALVTTALPLTV
jgi:hypothetical protein